MEFYGYKKCSTCRDAQKYLEALGINVPFHDFVAEPPSREQLKSWIAKHGQGIMPFVNTKGTVYRERGLKDQTLTEEEWIELLTADGKLLKRPIVVTEDAVIIGFDPTAYAALANRSS